MADRQYVVFEVARELYGLPIESVERILEEQLTTKIPRTPAMFLGLFDLRGEAVAAVDLRLRFEFPASTDPANFIVVQTADTRVAYKVDHVEGIWNFDEGDIDKGPSMLKGNADAFLSGIGKKNERLIVMLDPLHLLDNSVKKAVNKVAASSGMTR